MKTVAFFLIFLTGLLGGLWPLYLGRVESAKRAFALGSAFSAGVFLGAGFIHLLPDAMQKFTTLSGGSGYPVAALVCVCGFGLLLFTEKVLLGGSDSEEAAIAAVPAQGPLTLAYVLTVALSVHSLIAGIALGTDEQRSEFLVLLLAILAHKGAAAFALGVSLHRAGLARFHYLGILLVFCCMTPLGLVLGALVEEGVHGSQGALLTGLFNALAAGTFIYVATMDILPRELEAGGKVGPLFCFFSLGLAVMALVAIWT